MKWGPTLDRTSYYPLIYGGRSRSRYLGTAIILVTAMIGAAIGWIAGRVCARVWGML